MNRWVPGHIRKSFIRLRREGAIESAGAGIGGKRNSLTKKWVAQSQCKMKVDALSYGSAFTSSPDTDWTLRAKELKHNAKAETKNDHWNSPHPWLCRTAYVQWDMTPNRSKTYCLPFLKSLRSVPGRSSSAWHFVKPLDDLKSSAFSCYLKVDKKILYFEVLFRPNPSTNDFSKMFCW